MLVVGGTPRGKNSSGGADAIRSYPALTDIRAMFAGLFGRMYGLEGAALHRVFTGVRPAELGLV